MVAVTVLAMTTGACGEREEPGTPTAASPAVTTTEASGSAVRPTRPAVLPLDGVAPCDLVTDAMREQFQIDRPAMPSDIGSDPNTPGCTFISSTLGQYVVVVVRNKGVDSLGRPVTATVGGFPAVEIQRSNVKVGHVSVDVADGQRLDVEVQRLSSDQPVEQVYQDTAVFAEAVLAVLRQKLGR